MADYTQKQGTCRNCNAPTNAVLHQMFQQSGASSFVWVCARCNCKNPYNGKDFFIAKDKVARFLTAEQIDDLPVIMPDYYARCCRCGARGAELHHWGPRAIFGKDEAEQWPKDYLCKKCHDIWHLKVTPQLVSQ